MIVETGDGVLLLSGRYVVDAGQEEPAIAPDGGRLVVVELYVGDEAQEE